MAATIKIKNSSTASAVPTSSDLVQGELAVNVTDKRLFTENSGGTVVELGTNPTSLTVTNGATIQGLTVGKGAGAVSTNTAVGASALAANTTGAGQTVFGYQAGNALTTANDNTLIGTQAGLTLTGASNTAVGSATLGRNAGSTTGVSNSAFGLYSLTFLTTGSYNTAYGQDTLRSNTTASNNTAVGYQALYNNTTGSPNTANGYQAGFTNTTGGANAFYGYQAGYSSNGSSNTFLGVLAGYNITSGSGNTIVGRYNGNQGGLDIRTASNYIVLSDGDGNPRQIINNSGYLFYYTMASGAGTNALKFNTSTGAVTYDTSSARYKDNIRDSIYGLSHVMQMRSAQFEYKDTGRSDVGLIAEELDLIVPELVGKNADNQPDSVSYDRMVSVLVKAIQELKAEFDAYKEAHP